MGSEVMTNDASPAAAIEVRDLVVSYGERRAVDGVTLSVAQGTAVGLLGPNGSGKSTLLSAVAGLRAPQDGEVLILGDSPVPAVRRRVGVVFQESCLDPLMTLHETLWLHGRLFGLGRSPLARRIETLLDQFELTPRTRDAVGTLSGGLRRRLELARALLHEPQVLLLDEPTTGLDPDSKRAFWEHLRSVRGDSLALLLATNDVLEAERECDTVAFLHQGRLVAQGSPTELKGGLKHDSVRVECIDGRAQAISIAIAGWPGVGRVTCIDAVLHVTVDEASSFVPRLFQTEADGIHTIQIERSTLEDAYFQVAGASLSRPSEDAAT